VREQGFCLVRASVVVMLSCQMPLSLLALSARSLKAPGRSVVHWGAFCVAARALILVNRFTETEAASPKSMGTTERMRHTRNTVNPVGDTHGPVLIQKWR